jgi:hypothetical protein
VTTIASSTAIATAIGITSDRVAVLAVSRTSRISSVAYAFDESGSDAKTGSAIVFGRSVCSS